MSIARFLPEEWAALGRERLNSGDRVGPMSQYYGQADILSRLAERGKNALIALAVVRAAQA